jgi:hypothetical protein
MKKISDERLIELQAEGWFGSVLCYTVVVGGVAAISAASPATSLAALVGGFSIGSAIGGCLAYITNED